MYTRAWVSSKFWHIWSHTTDKLPLSVQKIDVSLFPILIIQFIKFLGIENVPDKLLKILQHQILEILKYICKQIFKVINDL